MRDSTLAVTICLQFVIVLSRLHQSCQDGQCGSSHIQKNRRDVLARKGGIKSNVCGPGSFSAPGSSPETVVCQICSVCYSDTWAALECTSGRDTVCCPQGMIAVQESDGMVCVINLSPRSQQISSDNSSTTRDSRDNTEKVNIKSFDSANKASSKYSIRLENNLNDESREPQIHLHKSFHGPDDPKGYMVHIPLVGWLIIAGIAVVFAMFCLVVGLPCNVCGILDKLRGRSKDTRHTESKRPINLKYETV